MRLDRDGTIIEYDDIEIGNCYAFGVRVRIGENQGKWGYVLSWAGKKTGYNSPLIVKDLIYSSRSEALNDARKEVLSLKVISEFTDKMIEEINEKLGAQLDLFGGEI